jgi:hypothetical protein
MIGVATLGGAAVSLAGLGWLAANDPKRRSAFRLPAPGRPRLSGAGWAVVLLPGVAVAALAGGGGFLAWFGLTAVAGWALAALPPGRAAAGLYRLEAAAAALTARAAPLAGAARRRLAALRPVKAGGAADPSRLAVLEARVAALESELAALRAAAAPNPPVVIELAARR